MPGVRVVTDSASDLPADLAAQHCVDVVPLTIRFGDEEFVDRRDLSPDEFWERAARSRTLPQTAAPSPGAFQDVFRRAAEDGADGVVCITLSADLSATFQSAQTAAEAVEGTMPVRVLDSRLVTMGLGLVVLEAAGQAAAGGGLEEVVVAAEAAMARTRLYGTLDTLENLKKGGRIGNAQALIGSMLSVKPVVEVRNGRVEPESRQRTRAKAFRHLADKVAAAPSVERVAVVHSQAPDLDQFLDLLSPRVPREEIVVADLGAVVGTHTGPRTVGVAFQTG